MISMTMTTVMSPKGHIALPAAIREELHLSPGDDFEIEIEDAETITLRRISKPANHGLIDLLLACPAEFELPDRDKDDTRPLGL